MLKLKDLVGCFACGVGVGGSVGIVELLDKTDSLSLELVITFEYSFDFTYLKHRKIHLLPCFPPFLLNPDPR